MRPNLPVIVAALAALTGCAKATSLPMTASDLLGNGAGQGLVTYLSQPAANPAVCDRKSRGLHIRGLDDDGIRALVHGFDTGRVLPDVFRRCAERLLQSRDPALVSSLLLSMGESYRALVKRPDLDRDPNLEERLSALQTLYTDRPNGADPDRERMTAWAVELSRAVAEKRIGPKATRYAQTFLATLSLERGLWNGAKVTTHTLDALKEKGDLALLLRFAARLPDQELRRQALRRVVRLHIAASAFPELREHAAEVEEIMMKRGRFAISPQKLAPVSGTIDTARLAVDGILVRQSVGTGLGRIFGATGKVVPEVPLSGLVQIELAGLSRPISICGPSRSFDPTPCIDPAALEVKNRLAALDHDGALLFADKVPLRLLIGPAHKKSFEIPIELAGEELFSIELGLRFETPEDVVFEGGQNLDVKVDASFPKRVIYTIQGGDRSLLAVVERDNLRSFHIVSRGVPGAQGYKGSGGPDGAAGTSGTNAPCASSTGPSGGRQRDSTAGGTAGAGQAGGPGGDITVWVNCGPQPCKRFLDELRGVFVSVGGQGSSGDGGGGGGERGANCPNDEQNTPLSNPSPSGASQRANSSDGTRDADGKTGSSGLPGKITFRPMEP